MPVHFWCIGAGLPHKAARELFSAHGLDWTAACVLNQDHGLPAFCLYPGPGTHAKQLLARQHASMHHAIPSAVDTLRGNSTEPCRVPLPSSAWSSVYGQPAHVRHVTADLIGWADVNVKSEPNAGAAAPFKSSDGRPAESITSWCRSRRAATNLPPAARLNLSPNEG